MTGMARLIVHVEASKAGIARARFAAAFAQAHATRCEALLIYPHAPYQHAPEMTLADARAELEGVANLDVTVFESHPDRVRTDSASLFRAGALVVLGPPHARLGFLDEDAFHAGLFMSGRPCLIVPDPPPQSSPGRRILIAWKDGAPAARAVHESLPLLRAASAVALCALKSPEDDTHVGMRALERLQAVLHEAGVRMEECVITDYSARPLEAMTRTVDAFNADLVVMGAYSRSRTSEVLFGGMTRAMLAAPPCALFMAH